MAFTIRTVQKVREIRKVNDLLLKEQKDIVKPKQYLIAAAAGGVPPSGGDKNPYKNISPEQMAKIMSMIGDSNKMLLNKNFLNKKII